jgi:hypothetical protein
MRKKLNCKMEQSGEEWAIFVQTSEPYIKPPNDVRHTDVNK